MKINRHNYEEFFILYMDNELSIDDRRMVENFLALHPDLKEELDLLHQYKLSPDTGISYSGKEDLMKVNGDSPVTLTNYEEWFVLYTDHELNAEQKIMVEDFIAKNPALQKELELFQKTKIQPELVLFADKKTLFRNEEKVFSLAFRRWRVAAAVLLLLGLGITTALFINKSKSSKNELVKGVEPPQIPNKENNIIVPDKKEVITENKNAVADLVQQAPAPLIKKHEIIQAVNNNKATNKKNVSDDMPSPEKNNELVIAVKDQNRPTNNLPQPDYNPNINKNYATKDVIADVTPPKEIINPEKALTKAAVTNPKEETSPTKNSDIRFAKLEENGENKKSRGFFRKLIRTFEKRTDIDATDDGKLLVGGFSINVK